MFSKFTLIVLLAIVPTVTATVSTTSARRVPTSVSTGSRHHHPVHSSHYDESSHINFIESIPESVDEPSTDLEIAMRMKPTQIQQREFEFETLQMELSELKELLSTIIDNNYDQYTESKNDDETSIPIETDQYYPTNELFVSRPSLPSRNLFSPSFQSMIAKIEGANSNDVSESKGKSITHCKNKKKLDICLLIAGVPNALLCALTGVETAGTMCLANLITFGAAAATCVYTNCDF